MARTPREISAEILAGLDILAEYKALGVEPVGKPRQSGMIACRAWGREDKTPSAWCNIKSGFYGDSGGAESAAYSCSLWDFAVKVNKFPDWQTARKFYAAKVGVSIGRERKPEGTDWREKLEFQDWEAPGNRMMAHRWCIQSKPGVTVEAIKAAGGMLGYYPCYRDKKTKELKRAANHHQVIALPAYGEFGIQADPVAWVLFDVTGQKFDVTPKDYPKDQPRVTAKMVSCGPTRGTMMGLAGLMVLADEERRAAVEWVWKTGGPTDMLGLMAAVSEKLRDKHVVVTNASGETGDVAPHQAKLLAGLRVAVVGDCDQAGQVGAEKWCRALAGLTAETRSVRLPWAVEPKHGRDMRDFLNGVPE